MTEPEWTTRPATPEDWPLIESTWLHSFSRSPMAQSRGAHVALSTERTELFDQHRPLVRLLLEHATTMVACDREDPSILWAWACTTGDIVHYALVLRAYVRIDPDGGAEMLMALLGDRLTKAAQYTYYPYDLHLLKALPPSWQGLAQQPRRREKARAA